MPIKIGIVGGTGALGGAIARALLHAGVVLPETLWLFSRTGGTGDLDGVQATTDVAELIAECEVILLAVPPAQFADMRFDASGRLVISVMAGATAQEIADRLGPTARIVRAMSSPAAAMALAYNPWYSPEPLTPEDRELVAAILGACGRVDEVASEDQIDHFTAMTGPVPGFVAYFAECMVDHAITQGIDPTIANRAIGQLFLASGRALADDATTAAGLVQEMVDYAGTTAAGLEEMRASAIKPLIAEGLGAAYSRTKSIFPKGAPLG